MDLAELATVARALDRRITIVREIVEVVDGEVRVVARLSRRTSFFPMEESCETPKPLPVD